jgi:nicotinamide-nucleotide amidase
MKAEIIAIGTEIILGDLINTNTPYLCKKLAEIGIEVLSITSIPDNPTQLKETIKAAKNRANIIITIGGLGPTEDDITTKAIAQALGRRLIFKKKVSDWIKDHFKKRNLKCPKINFKQAYIPEGAICLANKIGTAPAQIIETEKNNFLIALPGPPKELKPLFEEGIIPFLKKKQKVKKVIISRTIKTTGWPESKVATKVKDILKLKGDITVGIYPHIHEVDLKITARAASLDEANKKIDKIHNILKKRLSSCIFGIDQETIESVVGKLLTLKKKRLCIAESCTGGLLSSRVTDVPGSSNYFDLGVVVYSNVEKIRLLKIKKDVLKKYGAVSSQVARSMANNLRKICDVDFALSITGIAGGGRASTKKPVGLVYISLADRKGTQVKKFLFLGSRDMIKLQATEAALDMLKKKLM